MRTPPFRMAAPSYLLGGWIPLPLPENAKSPPPTGFTGNTDAIPTRKQIERWQYTRGYGNIALRLPPTVVGIDVDAYRGGGELLDRLQGQLEPLPPTFSTTARTDGSGVYYFRIPSGVQLAGQLGTGIEVIQHHHRYVVAPPSTHPELGTRYRWQYDRRDVVEGSHPAIEDLPPLPSSWVEAFRREPSAGRARRHPSTYGFETVDPPAPDAEPEIDRVGAIVQAFLDDHYHHLDLVDDSTRIARLVVEQLRPGPSTVRDGRRHHLDGTTTPGPVLYVVDDGRPVRPYNPLETLADHEAVGVFEFTTWARMPETEENPG